MVYRTKIYSSIKFYCYSELLLFRYLYTTHPVYIEFITTWVYDDDDGDEHQLIHEKETRRFETRKKNNIKIIFRRGNTYT